MKVKKQAQDVAKSTQRVIRNGESFIQSVSLLIIAAFSYYATRELNLNKVLETVVVVALVVIGLRGATEFIKFLDVERSK